MSKVAKVQDKVKKEAVAVKALAKPKAKASPKPSVKPKAKLNSEQKRKAYQVQKYTIEAFRSASLEEVTQTLEKVILALQTLVVACNHLKG